ncbi:MAG: hypothetical protein RhofKO_32860 [Rhodothermales bacterium]
MVKWLLMVGLLFSLATESQAQVLPQALGVRLGGDGDTNGAEISYQRGLRGENRLEFDVGLDSNRSQDRLSAAVLYHWVWHITGGLNWYAGPGGMLSLISNDNGDDRSGISVGGQVGLEFDFNTQGAPILLSLDTRPMWDLLGDGAEIGWGTALGVRYTW